MSDRPLVILTLDRLAFIELHRRAQRNEPAALVEVTEMWQPWAGQEIQCFVCGGIACEPLVHFWR